MPLLISARCQWLLWEVGLLACLCLLYPRMAESLTPSLTPILWGRFSVPPLLSLLDYSSLFMFFSFAGVGQGSVCPGAATCGAWCSFVPSTVSHRQLWSQLLARRNGITVFSAVWRREAFLRLGVQDVTELDSDWCFIFCLLGEERKKRSCWGLFSQGGGTHLALCAVWIFMTVGCKLKADLRVSLWILSAPNVMAVILARSNQNYPSVAPTSQGGFWNSGVLIPYLSYHFGSPS
jgi:hypothetical protein